MATTKADLAKDLRALIERLEGDTMVSMHEGINNERFAQELRSILFRNGVMVPFTVDAEIDVCSGYTGKHEPHLRRSLFSRPQRWLWCLGYYDQKRQCNRVRVEVGGTTRREKVTLVEEFGKPWEKQEATT